MTSSEAPQSWRFLLTRRWVLFFLAIIVLGAGCWWLGRWQFHRLENTKSQNSIIKANYKEQPEPVGDVMAPGRSVADLDEWRVVEATGTYDPKDTIVVRYRSDDDGDPGVNVVVPLITANGTALLVNRGWYGTASADPDPASMPTPPAGQVTVTGWVRQDGSGESTIVSNDSVRAVSSSAIGKALGLTTYGGFVQLQTESPSAAHPLQAGDMPDLSNGPHFFYGLQWWFFGVLALGGFGYLAWDERNNGNRAARRRAAAAAADAETERGREAGRRQPQSQSQPQSQPQSERDMPPSTGSITPETNDAAGESRKAAARPNSSGRP